MENNKIHPVISFIIKHWITNILICLIMGIFILIYVFIIAEKQYTANVTIIPNAATFSQGLSAQLGALAGLTGFDLSSNSGQSQEMFRGILTSRLLLENILYDKYTIEIDGEQKTERLIDFVDLKAIDHSDSLEKALKMMKEEVINISIDVDNNILDLAITLNHPMLSAAVANRMIEVLDDIVQNRVQKEFKEQLAYLQKRLMETENNMTISEGNLERFLEKIKNYSEPKNQVEELRLKRDLELQTVIYTELNKQMETFILQNMINLSHIKVLDEAIPPFKKSRPKRILLTISLGLLWVCVQVGINAFIVYGQQIKNDLTS